jgi:alkylhydroperoxidase family enzyme
MTRIPLVDSNSDDADPAAREVLRWVTGGRGGSIEPNVYRAIANHPEALRAMVEFGKAVYFDSSVTPAERELAYLTASVTNDCHY